MNKTITAISTPLGNGAIGIVRLSGEKALDIALSLFVCRGLSKENIKPRYMYLGEFSCGGIKDKCLMVYFKAPNSYTGEDMIEFQVHGGAFLVENILNQCLNNGATLAENGEFTKLAFINGKISLDSAQGIIDIINATSLSEINAGNNLMQGKLCQNIISYQKTLLNILAELDVSLDYPEHDEETQISGSCKPKLQKICKGLEDLAGTYHNGRLIKSGVNIAIVGKTNVGKSSLLNALIGREKAIVTEIAGTTRDIVEETIVFKGLKFNFLDTAGVRNVSDVVEQIGIEKSKESIQNADIILFVIDGSKPSDKEDEQVYSLLKDKNHIVVCNKQDLGKCVLQYENMVHVSAKENQNLETLKDKIYKSVISENLDSNYLVITNLRHFEAIKKACEMCKRAILLCDKQSVDILAFEVRNIWEELGKITGETEIESVIDEIFSKFCLGK